MADPLALFFAQKGQPAAGSAAETALTCPRWIDHVAETCENGTRLFVHASITSQVAGIVVDDLLPAAVLREFFAMAREELAVMLDRWSFAVLSPIVRNRAHAVGADGNNLFDPGLSEAFQVLFRQLLEHQVISQPPCRIARAFFLA